jgi:tRNA A-37 threonylcarbamoyl transferase component Bud32/membrane-associated phospholipid phosphatase
VVAAAAVLGLWTALAVEPTRRVITAVDLAVLELLSGARVAPVTDLLAGGEVPGAPWTVRVLAWVTLAVAAAFRRYQHVLVYLAVALVTTTANSTASLWLGRMRPAGIDLVGAWSGFSHPSTPVAALGLTSVAALYCLAPQGRWRNRAAWVAGAAVGALAMARLYLGVDHPTDVAAGLATGVAVPTVAFRVLAPEEAFPITYHRRRRAHLDVSGARGVAIRAALEAQLGLRVVGLEPFALAGSSGSTPLRVGARQPDGTERTVFAKLYAVSHLRSDRWYKLARAVLYGRLEDELPFNAVRRLVGYEDHMLRLLRDAGVPTADPLGIVEITPEREYLLVTDFLDGAHEISEVPITDQVIDEALEAVRALWRAGLAHRDIKPSNVLVRDGHVHLIDVAFGEARPSPWRQAVDLANMALTLALTTSAERVYERALQHFSPDELAEAFAASRGVTMPSQLRSRLRADGRDLLGTFRQLAPRRPPVAIQRWSLRRVGLSAAVAGGAAAAVLLLGINLRLAGLL